MAKLAILEMAVASEAPATPISRLKIKIGSKKQFKMPPNPMPNMERMGLPSARRHWFMTKVVAIKGATIST